MNRCPSHDWDRYCRDNDPPEVCPCGKDNADENGEPVCKDAPDFCSAACRDAYVKAQQDSDRAEAQYQTEMDAMQPEIDAAIADCREVERGMADEGCEG